MAARNWTFAQRKQQAEKIRQWQPWTCSTGAKTPQGKAISSQNAYKHGVSKVIKEVRWLYKAHEDFMSFIDCCITENNS